MSYHHTASLKDQQTDEIWERSNNLKRQQINIIKNGIIHATISIQGNRQQLSSEETRHYVQEILTVQQLKKALYRKEKEVASLQKKLQMLQ